ncbi:MAG TPA: filamentation induced by camp protein fic [Marinilabiliaceae bacterium]|nr:filamentation induced by camp protein fic [Marinilabiliaceae bacterium]
MSDSYKYLDFDYIYTDPKTGLLRNLADITDSDDLLFFESVAVAKRIHELEKKPIKIKGIDSLLDIHKHLFQDVYSWAGKRRKVEINKAGNQFFPTSHFDNAFRYIDSLISDYRSISKGNNLQIAEKLAEILDNVNYLHPFREGNGRAQREFLRLLALEKGLKLKLNPPDDKTVYDQYMLGTINSDIKTLTKLILDQIEA